MKNLYAIRCLQSVMITHRKEIDRLEKIESEMVSDTIFANEEIKEREDYINQLQNAIKQLK